MLAMHRRRFLQLTATLPFALSWKARSAYGENIAEAAIIYTALLQKSLVAPNVSSSMTGVSEILYKPARPILALEGEHPNFSAADGGMRTMFLSPPDQADMIKGLVESLLAAATKPNFLPRDIKLPNRYVLLSEEDLRQYENLHASQHVVSPKSETRVRSVPDAYRERLQHLDDILTFSPVAFTPDGSIALTASSSIGGGCVSEEFHVMSKSAGAWHEVEWNMRGVGICA